ncbi:hypothetical protein C5167_011966 [Papaver somniferum]|uniref:Uncharacterized protein n=1 Tax=Papaver somniferum TaxID=3469 RepID=A0A4Y7J0C1_PAPSO|nr:hypothetical protein C5167_011966 [Papaver somniferum]
MLIAKDFKKVGLAEKEKDLGLIGRLNSVLTNVVTKSVESAKKRYDLPMREIGNCDNLMRIVKDEMLENCGNESVVLIITGTYVKDHLGRHSSDVDV